jgi:hypothetical protein
MKFGCSNPRRLLAVCCCFAINFILAPPSPSHAQEKKLVRMVFVSLAWNSEILFAFWRAVSLSLKVQIEPILTAVARRRSRRSLQEKSILRASAGAVFRGKSRGLDLAIVGCISSTTNYILLGNKQTRTVEDLKGKAIGITGAGTYSEFAVRAF